MRLSAIALASFWTAPCFGQRDEPKANPIEANRLVEANKWYAEALTAYGEKNFAKAAELYIRAFDAGAIVPAAP